MFWRHKNTVFVSLTLCFHSVNPMFSEATCATSTGSKSHIGNDEVVRRQNDDEKSLHSPVFAAAHFYLFHKNTSPPHLTPRKARYTKGLKQVRCRSNTSLTPHWHLPDTYLKKWGHSEVVSFNIMNKVDKNRPFSSIIITTMRIILTICQKKTQNVWKIKNNVYLCKVILIIIIWRMILRK